MPARSRRVENVMNALSLSRKGFAAACVCLRAKAHVRAENTSVLRHLVQRAPEADIQLAPAGIPAVRAEPRRHGRRAPAKQVGVRERGPHLRRFSSRLPGKLGIGSSTFTSCGAATLSSRTNLRRVPGWLGVSIAGRSGEEREMARRLLCCVSTGKGAKAGAPASGRRACP